MNPWIATEYKLTVWTIKATAQNARTRRFAHALTEIAIALRGLGDSDSLTPVRNQASVAVHKILGGGSRRLLGCVDNPHLPPLKPIADFPCKPYELFAPLLVRLSPPTDPDAKHGTGLEIDNRGVVFALHGLDHDLDGRGSGHFRRRSPWDAEAEEMPVRDWINQPLVQVNRHVLTLGQVLKHVRDQQGAHADRSWTKDVPQPLRRFYDIYAGLCVLETARMLLETALSQDEGFTRVLFPRRPHPETALRHAVSEIERYHYSTQDAEWEDPEGHRFEFCYADETHSAALQFRREPLRPLKGSIAKSTSIWVIRAPGAARPDELRAINQMLERPGVPVFRPSQES